MHLTSINQATAKDRIENYRAGQELRKGWGKKSLTEIGKEMFTGTTQFFRGKSRYNMHNPIVPNMADYVNWILYDRLVTAAGGTIPTTTGLFTIPIGQSSKTKVDTNLDLVSQLPQPYWINATHL